MNRKVTLVTAVAAAAMVVGVPVALADPWGADRQNGASVVGSPDLADRVIVARQKEREAMLDARERSQATPHGGVSTPMVERQRPLVGDGGDRFTIDGSGSSLTVAPSASGREIEWSQIGFGVVVGILFTLGLMLVMRTARSLELAH